MRTALLLAMLAAAGCRQATPTEVGVHSTRDAHPIATMHAAEHGHEMSPAEVAPAATGTPLRQPPPLDRSP